MKGGGATVVFAGGGTGGPLMPGIALARELAAARPEVSVVFAVGRRSVERNIVSMYGFPRAALATPAWRAGLARYPLMLASVLFSWMRSLLFMVRCRTRAVVGLGGYGSVGPVLAAWVLRRRIYLLEQNAVPGRANRLLARFAHAVFTHFEEAASHFGRVTVKRYGNPVRGEIRSISSGTGRFGLLVMGGSQGARNLNRIVMDALPAVRFPPGSRVIHVCGESFLDECRRRYARIEVRADVTLVGFHPRMEEVYRDASLAVSRAGATSIAEMTCVGIPMILVPFPFATDDHQYHNAREVVRAGAGMCVREEELDPAVLAGMVNGLIEDPGRLARMRENARKAGRPEAAARIAECVAGGWR